MGPELLSPMNTRVMYSRDIPHVGCICLLAVVGLMEKSTLTQLCHRGVDMALTWLIVVQVYMVGWGTQQCQQVRVRLPKWHLPVLALARYKEISKMMSASTSIVERVPTGSCHSSSHFKISKWVSFTYDLDAFQPIGFVLGPRVDESLLIGFPSLGSPGHTPCLFSNQTFW